MVDFKKNKIQLPENCLYLITGPLKFFTLVISSGSIIPVSRPYHLGINFRSTHSPSILQNPFSIGESENSFPFESSLISSKQILDSGSPGVLSSIVIAGTSPRGLTDIVLNHIMLPKLY